jgi:hypothetical protein
MDCEEILKKNIEPGFRTYLIGFITFGEFNKKLILENLKVHNEYHRCLLNNIKNRQTT